LVADGPGAQDQVIDDGSLCPDCNQTPPFSSESTNATSRFTVMVPAAGQPVETVRWRLYGTTDGGFGSPALLGDYPVSELGTVKNFTALVLSEGSPPPLDITIPGAEYIDALTEIVNLSWKAPVDAPEDLLTSGNTVGDARLVLSTNEIWVWDSADEWVLASGAGGGGGGSWKPPVSSESNLPTTGVDGDTIVTSNTNEIWAWEDGLSDWVLARAYEQERFAGFIYSNDLAQNAQENQDLFNMPAQAAIHKVVTVAPARIRLYVTGEKRAADAARPFGTPPTGNHGCILDVQTSPGNLVWYVTPAVVGFNDDGEALGDHAWRGRVTQLDPATRPVQADVHFVQIGSGEAEGVPTVFANPVPGEVLSGLYASPTP
jgi:hypothetical protein